jgi:hypothetical protein
METIFGGNIMELLSFIFQSLGHFIGFVLLLAIVLTFCGQTLTNILNFRLSLRNQAALVERVKALELELELEATRAANKQGSTAFAVPSTGKPAIEQPAVNPIVDKKETMV